MAFESKIKTIEWVNNASKMIDQTILPYEFKTVEVTTTEGMYFAIKDMIVRGAPAIGIAGAHGVALSALELKDKNLSYSEFISELEKKGEYLKSSRPTAVNLQWAVDKQLELAKKIESEGLTVRQIEDIVRLINEADTEPPKREKPKDDMAFVYRDLEKKLSESLGTKVKINRKAKGKGKIEISYYSEDELDRLYEIINKGAK